MMNDEQCIICFLHGAALVATAKKLQEALEAEDSDAALKAAKKLQKMNDLFIKEMEHDDSEQ